jgi:16S rRNA (adenine1518-N6/adenine1519-N6)-dimethyltransferase
MLRSSLKSLGDAEALLAAEGIDPTARAEELPVAAFCALAQAVDRLQEPPTPGTRSDPR